MGVVSSNILLDNRGDLMRTKKIVLSPESERTIQLQLTMRIVPGG